MNLIRITKIVEFEEVDEMSPADSEGLTLVKVGPLWYHTATAELANFLFPTESEDDAPTPEEGVSNEQLSHDNPRWD